MDAHIGRPWLSWSILGVSLLPSGHYCQVPLQRANEARQDNHTNKPKEDVMDDTPPDLISLPDFKIVQQVVGQLPHSCLILYATSVDFHP